MKCLTNHEASVWLRQHGMDEDPYHGTASPEHYLQFRAPTGYRRLEALARHCFGRIIPESASLVRVTDWAQYTPGEMAVFTAVRSAHGEDRRLVDAPGHLVGSEEVDVAASLFALSADFGWSAYLYSPVDRTTVYNWEGELLDFWSDSVGRLLEMRRILAELGLEEVPPVSAGRE